MQENREKETQVTKGRGRKITATTRRTQAAAGTEKAGPEKADPEKAGPGAKTAVLKANTRGGRGSIPREKMVHQLQAAVNPQAKLKEGERIIPEVGTKAAAVIEVEEERAVGKVARRVGRKSPTNSSSRKRAHQIMPTTWGFS